jgi:hypothetical protein
MNILSKGLVEQGVFPRMNFRFSLLLQEKQHY